MGGCKKAKGIRACVDSNSRKALCVKCKTSYGTVRFPCSTEKAKCWSKSIAVKLTTGKDKPFSGKKNTNCVR
jgi:hypothetical protein